VSRWVNDFSENTHFKGVWVREEKPPQSILDDREKFHKEHAGQKELTQEMTRTLNRLYPYFDETEQAMITMFGVPEYSVTSVPDPVETAFLGKNINGESAKRWVKENYPDSKPFLFSHLGQIVKPWLIKYAENRLLNVHSAVLPYVRGIYSIENIAAVQDVDLLRKAAGFTIHFINEGVDTGPIVRAERVRDPLGFNSIWELKGYVYHVGYRFYAETARSMLFDPDTISVGIVGDPQLQGVNFRSRQMTNEKKQQAEQGYLTMKLNG